MAKVSAGSYDLNKWLSGGYETDIISVLYGGSGTGKTNFCICAAVSQALKGNRVIYIDTEGGFSSERVKQIVSGKKDFQEGDVDNVLANILLLKPTSFQEQEKAFEILVKEIKQHVALIIVDGMTILYRLDAAEAREKSNGELQKINALLARQMKVLAEISRKHEIPVIVTNQVYKWEDNMQMVGGDIMKYWAKCHIELVKNDGKRVAYLRKHRSLPDKELTFEIIESGIRKRGWL